MNGITIVDPVRLLCADTNVAEPGFPDTGDGTGGAIAISGFPGTGINPNISFFV
jgi:hypothetical protein